MSLYFTQKLLYELNKDEALQERFFADAQSVMQNYTLTDEEKMALTKPDIGLLYILGVNGQILMHFAALCSYSWPEYIQAMKDALQEHGNVREGLYASTGNKGAV